MCCVALLGCLFDLACFFFLPSTSLINMYMEFHLFSTPAIAVAQTIKTGSTCTYTCLFDLACFFFLPSTSLINMYMEFHLFSTPAIAVAQTIKAGSTCTYTCTIYYSYMEVHVLHILVLHGSTCATYTCTTWKYMCYIYLYYMEVHVHSTLAFRKCHRVSLV